MTKKEENNSNLIPLVPVDNADNIKNYKHYLDKAFEDENVYNIALSGNYGSGKSSIISTYFKDQKQDDVLKISLANFNSDNTEEVTKNIEKNIINQILYQIPTKNIPLTSFKVKREINWLQRSLFAIEILCLLTYLVNVPYLWLRILRYIVTAGFLFWNVTSVLKYLPIQKLNLKFQNVETEIMNKPDELFEKYADEIVYLLEKSGKHILVIEDLDRFDQIDIFEKLRELNIKINNKLSQNSKLDKKQSKFVFLYAIKDDLFQKNVDRTKFFDLIIPVIPHVNAYNSYEQMKKLFNGIDKKLLQELGYYIPDNRLLTNIYNEFVIFKEELKSKNAQKLLPLIVYKNLFPNDFEKSKKRKGILYGIIDLKNQGIKELKNLIDEKENEIREIPRKLFSNWLSAYATYSNTPNAEFLIKNSHYNFDYGSNSSLKVNRTNYNQIINGENDTDELKILQENIQIESSILKDEIIKLQNDVKSNTMKNIITFSLIDSEIKRRNIENSEDEKAMWFLYRQIKSGWIDEYYEMFINYDYGDTQDNQFMINIHNSPNKPLSMSIKLNDFIKINSGLNEDDYHNISILNYSLLDYCLKKDIDKAITILKTAINSNTEFIEQYINESSENGLDIIEYLNDLDYKLNLKNINYVEDKFIDHELYIENDENFAEILNSNWKEALINQDLVEKLLLEKGNTKLKRYLIKHLATKVNLVSGAEEFFDDLILYNKVKITVENVLAYMKYSEEVNQHLIEFINKNSRFTNTVDTYENQEVKNLIFNHKNIEITNLKELILSEEINRELAIEILFNRIDELSMDEVMVILERLRFNDFSKLKSIKEYTNNYYKFKIEVTDYSEVILNRFVQDNIISDFEDDGNGKFKIKK